MDRRLGKGTIEVSYFIKRSILRVDFLLMHEILAIALPTSMFLGPKMKRPKVLTRTKTPEVEAVNYQMQETHVTSPKKENERTTSNEKEKVSKPHKNWILLFASH